MLVLPAIVIVPATSGAQLPSRVSTNGGSLEAGFASTTIDGYSRSSLSDIASSIWGAAGRFSAVGDATVTRFASGNVSAYGEAHGAVSLSSNPGNFSELSIDAGGGSYRGRTASRYVETSLLFGSAPGDARRAGWFEASVGRARQTTALTTARGTVGASARSQDASIAGTLSYSVVSSSRYADVAVSTRWAPFGTSMSGPRFEAGADAGVRVANNIPGRTAWLAGTAALQISDPVSLVAYAGAQPSDPMRGTTGFAFSSVALRVRFGAHAAAGPTEHTSVPGAATSVSGEVADGERVITVILAHSSKVEIMGDFTDWLPVEMSSAGHGVWQIRVKIGQGSHRMNLRSNAGPWLSPPGLPVAADDFDGTVGILVVR